MGTLVVNNSALCFTANLAWNRRNDSLLEYTNSQACFVCTRERITLDACIFQCPSITCNMFTQGSLCVSRCAGCGVLCEPFPITDIYSLGLYLSRGCTTVVGDLHIMNLPSTVTKTIMINNLATVRYITGTLFIINCPWLGSLQPFKSIVSLGGAFYSDNPNLVDARMPALKQLGSNVTVVNCNRLCPARYTVVGMSPSDAGCPNLQLEFSFLMTGNVSVTQLSLIEQVVYNALRGIGKNSVWLHSVTFLHLSYFSDVALCSTLGL